MKNDEGIEGREEGKKSNGMMMNLFALRVEGVFRYLRYPG